jgi:UDP-glucose:glycoprotein glucosyltransferase
MDLRGAPYGFTPFCSDRPEMNGYKFWLTGFWKDHLRGRRFSLLPQ